MELSSQITLERISVDQAELVWKMQVEAFQEMYERYQDTETSPATEPLSKAIDRLNQDFTYFYFIISEGEKVGAIRVVDEKRANTRKRISPIFVMPQHRNKGIAQKAIAAVEEIHGAHNWCLETILQEEGNCHLYEKLGYERTGETWVINDRLTLVGYAKD